MENNLINFELGLKASLKAYFATAYRTRYPVLDDAIQNYFSDSETSPVFAEPIFELLPRYIAGDRTIESLVEKHFDSIELGTKRKLKKLLAPLGSYTLFRHQLESVESVLDKRRNLIVTTGTGSGKTYCFLLPLIFNLLKESLGVTGTGRWNNGSRQQRPWWLDQKSSFKNPRISKRTPAVRAMLIYPLNALVRDQIEQLRKIFESPQAREFYSESLGGDSIYFGQYNGDTLGKGDIPENPKILNEVRNELNALNDELELIDGDTFMLQDPKGVEQLTRWEMQDTPPDILITNFSMLAIMLVREREQNIFDSTKRWLAESNENIFHLILDELHSYTGTGGTEISYTVRQLIDRLGLHIGHDQLRVICTSASLEGAEDELNADHPFIKDFFGCNDNDKNFDVIPENIVKPSKLRPNLRSLSNDLSALSTEKNITKIENSKEKIDLFFHKKVENFNLEKGAEDYFEDLLFDITDKKLDRDLAGNAFTISELAETYFDNEKEPARGLLHYISNLKGGDSIQSLCRLRQHVFIKNMNGIRTPLGFGPKFEDVEVLDENANFSSLQNSIAYDLQYL